MSHLGSCSLRNTPGLFLSGDILEVQTRLKAPVVRIVEISTQIVHINRTDFVSDLEGVRRVFLLSVLRGIFYLKSLQVPCFGLFLGGFLPNICSSQYWRYRADDLLLGSESAASRSTADGSLPAIVTPRTTSDVGPGDCKTVMNPSVLWR